MEILFTAWRDLAHPEAGGSEVLVHRLAQGLHEKGHAVTVLAGGPVVERDYAVVDAGGRLGQYLQVPLRHRRRFRSADLVVDVANGMVAFSPLWSRTPTLCLVHHVHTEQWAQHFGKASAAVGRTLEARMMPRVYRRARFVAVSPSTADALARLGVPPDHIDVVPNGVDVPRAVGPRSEEPLFVVLGRLVPHKRVELALEAWREVGPEVGGRLVVAGTGPEESCLRALGVPEVDWLGHVAEEAKSDLLARAWALIHPAMHEGWGLVIMEAAAVGTPTIGFPVDGVRDAVVAGTTGELVAPPGDLATAWAALGGDPGRCAELGANARARAREFSWAKTVDRFAAVAEAHVGEGRPERLRRRPC